jgi:hypothetical protein
LILLLKEIVSAHNVTNLRRRRRRRWGRSTRVRKM